MDNPYSPIKVYIAAPFEHRPEALRLKAELERHGLIVTSTWLTDADGNSANMATISNRFHDCRMRAIKDVDDIRRADYFVLIKPQHWHRAPTTGGHQAEQMAAWLMGKPSFILGSRENVFHYLPGVETVWGVESLLFSMHIFPRGEGIDEILGDDYCEQRT